MQNNFLLGKSFYVFYTLASDHLRVVAEFRKQSFEVFRLQSVTIAQVDSSFHLSKWIAWAGDEDADHPAGNANG